MFVECTCDHQRRRKLLTAFDLAFRNAFYELLRTEVVVVSVIFFIVDVSVSLYRRWCLVSSVVVSHIWYGYGIFHFFLSQFFPFHIQSWSWMLELAMNAAKSHNDAQQWSESCVFVYTRTCFTNEPFLYNAINSFVQWTMEWESE